MDMNTGRKAAYEGRDIGYARLVSYLLQSSVVTTASSENPLSRVTEGKGKEDLGTLQAAVRSTECGIGSRAVP